MEGAPDYMKRQYAARGYFAIVKDDPKLIDSLDRQGYKILEHKMREEMTDELDQYGSTYGEQFWKELEGELFKRPGDPTISEADEVRSEIRRAIVRECIEVAAEHVDVDEVAGRVLEFFKWPKVSFGAGDWDESQHPRGPDGKFIDKDHVAANMGVYQKLVLNNPERELPHTKVVDKNGKPKKVYQQGDDRFVSKKVDGAKPVYLNLVNPFYWEAEYLGEPDMGMVVANAKKFNHDGVIIRRASGTEYLTFETLTQARATEAEGVQDIVASAIREEIGRTWDASKHPRCPDGRFASLDRSNCGGEGSGHPVVIPENQPAYNPQWRETVSAEDFIKARNKSKYAEFLSPIEPSDLDGHKLFLSRDGAVGAAVSPEGDIQNVFNNGGPKGAAKEALITAINNGGVTLDCYDGYLPTNYANYGFTETNRMRFVREYAPESWDYDRFGEPDVVFMARTNNYSNERIRANANRPKTEWQPPAKSNDYTTDWDGAKERSRSAARQAKG